MRGAAAARRSLAALLALACCAACAGQAPLLVADVRLPLGASTAGPPLFNPSLVVHGGLVLATARSLSKAVVNGTEWWTSVGHLCVGAAGADELLATHACSVFDPWRASHLAYADCLKPPGAEPPVAGLPKDARGVEDPKLFVWPGRGVFAVFNRKPRADDPAAPACARFGFTQFLQTVLYDGPSPGADAWHLRAPVQLSAGAFGAELYAPRQGGSGRGGAPRPPARLVKEKNWMPFVWSGELHLTHSITPHRVVNASGAAVEQWVSSAKALLPAAFLGSGAHMHMHGGPPLVHVDAAASGLGRPYFLGVMHFFDMPERPGARRYRHYAYGMEAGPPFRLCAVAAAPLPLPGPGAANASAPGAQPNMWTKGIHFVSGLQLAPGGLVRASYGAFDAQARLSTLSLAALEAQLGAWDCGRAKVLHGGGARAAYAYDGPRRAPAHANSMSAEQGRNRGTKRKLADEGSPSQEPSSSEVEAEVGALIAGIRAACSLPVDKVDRTALRKQAHQLADFCKTDELVEMIVGAGAIDAVVPLLTIGDKADAAVQQSFTEVRKEACFIIGLLAVKPEYQHSIASAQALPGLVRLLAAHNISGPAPRPPSAAGGPGSAGGAPGGERSGSGGVARRAADAITNLAHENLEIKNLVRRDGGIAPLVRLLSSWDLKVQRAGAGALRTLAFKNDDNKRQIVECGALPLLIQMLRSEDSGVHYEAVGVIGNLVHSSTEIKQRVLEEGALQPVINLLSSSCHESQREAALLLGQFATQQPNDDGPDYKSRIVQRGGVPPLIRMLASPDTALKEMAAFALGRLAQNTHNQAGIVQCGGLPQLLELLESKHYNLQHNAAFALYGLSDNEDNVPCIVQAGGLQRLYDCCERLQVQASKDCVNKTIARIKQKLERDDKRVLSHVIYSLRSSDRSVQQATAVSLAQLAPSGELKHIFVDKAGLDVLLDLLTDTAATAKQLCEGAAALLELAKKVNATSPVEAQPAQPQKSVYLGEEYVNSKTLADICFLVEGRPFYAHRIALLASSEAFRAMFNQGFRESEAASIDIPNIGYGTFTCMMRYIYCGSVQVDQDDAMDLLQASDQYLLEGLKRLCEAALAQSLSVENLLDVWQASEAYSAPQLAKRCVLFALEHCQAIIGAPPPPAPADSADAASAAAFAELMQRMVPALRSNLVEDLNQAARLAEEGAAAAGSALGGVAATAAAFAAAAAAPAAGAGAGAARRPVAAAAAARRVVRGPRPTPRCSNAVAPMAAPYKQLAASYGAGLARTHSGGGGGTPRRQAPSRGGGQLPLVVVLSLVLAGAGATALLASCAGRARGDLAHLTPVPARSLKLESDYTHSGEITRPAAPAKAPAPLAASAPRAPADAGRRAAPAAAAADAAGAGAAGANASAPAAAPRGRGLAPGVHHLELRWPSHDAIGAELAALAALAAQPGPPSDAPRGGAAGGPAGAAKPVSVVIMNWSRPQVKHVVDYAANAKHGLSVRFLGCLLAAEAEVLLQARRDCAADDDVLVLPGGLADLAAARAEAPHPAQLVGFRGRDWNRTHEPSYNRAEPRPGSHPVALTIALAAPRPVCAAFFKYAPAVEDLVADALPLWNGEDIFLSLVSHKLSCALPRTLPGGWPEKAATRLKYFLAPSTSDVGMHKRFAASHFAHRQRFLRLAARRLGVYQPGRRFAEGCGAAPAGGA
ncbi:hypothetical protein HT031_005532 [Scenedesmus sp. PABB004]|nr:hypothetical protein HT031_005532 [Scenedesmus sp. PABB004]